MAAPAIALLGVVWALTAISPVAALILACLWLVLEEVAAW